MIRVVTPVATLDVMLVAETRLLREEMSLVMAVIQRETRCEILGEILVLVTIFEMQHLT